MAAIGYFEIQADDPERAMAFYGQAFGWTFVQTMTTPISYWEIGGAGIPGGVLGRPAPVPMGGAGTNAFTCSVEVADFDAAAQTILAAGGIEALPKFAVPRRCWQGYFLDPEGNTFGIFQPDESAA
jgi:predicted enzyme related to lactoylglutathione lyase